MSTDHVPFRSLYDSALFSDITLCFGDQAIKAHKAVLMGVSPVFFAKFKEVTQDKTYAINGHNSNVVLAMIRHIYGFPLKDGFGDLSDDQKIDCLLRIYAIGDEYQIPSLRTTATNLVLGMLHDNSAYWDETQKLKFRMIIGKTAEFYADKKVTDTSLMTWVVHRCLRGRSLAQLEGDFVISEALAASNPFFATLIHMSSNQDERH